MWGEGGKGQRRGCPSSRKRSCTSTQSKSSARDRRRAQSSSRRLSIRPSPCGLNAPSPASRAYTQLDRSRSIGRAGRPAKQAISRSQIVDQRIGPERDTRYQGTGLGSGGHHLIQLPRRSRAAARQPCDKTRLRRSKWHGWRTMTRAAVANLALVAG